MTKQEIFEAVNKNPAFHLATVEGDQPRVRGMMLYKADESGIVFHTGTWKDVFKQLNENKKAELCFSCGGVQIRISGELELVDDNNLKDEISNHPSRAFLKPWRESGPLQDFYNSFAVFRMKNGTAVTWTMETNFAPKEEIQL